MTTHYEVLDVSPDASTAHIREKYHQAILNLHPDKVQGKKDDVDNYSGGCSEDFIRVRSAWNVLKDSDSRAQYDKILASNALTGIRVVIGDVVALEEMDTQRTDDSMEVEFFCECRCGDFYVVSEMTLRDRGFVIQDAAKTASSQLGMKDLKEDHRERSEIQCTKASKKEINPMMLLPCNSCSLYLQIKSDFSSKFVLCFGRIFHAEIHCCMMEIKKLFIS